MDSQFKYCPKSENIHFMNLSIETSTDTDLHRLILVKLDTDKQKVVNQDSDSLQTIVTQDSDSQTQVIGSNQQRGLHLSQRKDQM